MPELRPPMAAAAGFAKRKRMELLILVSMTTIYFFSFFQRVAVPGTLFDELQREFSASAGAITGLAAIYLYLYGAMQPITGILADRLGAAKVVLIGGFLLSAGSLLFPLAGSIPALYAARALVGLGASLIYVSIAKALDGLFGAAHFVVFLGLVIFLGYAGGLVATWPFERLASAFGWRAGLTGVGLACTVALVGAFLLFRRTGQLAHHASGSSLRAVGIVLCNRDSWPNFLLSVGNFAVYFLVQATIGKKFLTDYGGLTSAAAASFTGVMILVVMCTALAGGFLSRLLGNRRKPLVIASVACVLSGVALMLLLLRLDAAGAWFLPCYILLAFSSIGSAAGSALMKELNPPDIVGTTVGLLNASCYLAVAVVSSAAGVIMDRFDDRAVRTATAVIYPKEAYESILLLCLALSVTSLVAACFVRETRGRSRESARPAAARARAGSL
ncbi:MAG: MFS transporter [Armatimonadetes bacterium]|nr:MFS transporter [Armatimonadota bacterium]